MDSDLPRSRPALVLTDFTHPLGFPGYRGLAVPALTPAGRRSGSCVRSGRNALPVIDANLTFDTWQSARWSSALDKKACPSGATKMPRPSAAIGRSSGRCTRRLDSLMDLVLERMAVRSVSITGFSPTLRSACRCRRHFAEPEVHVAPKSTAAESETRKAAALLYMRDIVSCGVRFPGGLLAGRRLRSHT